MKNLSMNLRPKKVKSDIETVHKKDEQIFVICDNIRSLYNVGSILRTSDGAGIIKKIYLTGMTGYPKPDDPSWTQTQKIAKTSLGAEQFVNWEYLKDPIKLVKNLKSKAVKIYCLENNIGSVSEDYSKVKYSFPMALVVGHEVKGIKNEILKISDNFIHIPMRGKKESLNVASAYAIAIYEISKQLYS